MEAAVGEKDETSAPDGRTPASDSCIVATGDEEKVPAETGTLAWAAAAARALVSGTVDADGEKEETSAGADAPAGTDTTDGTVAPPPAVDAVTATWAAMPQRPLAHRAPLAHRPHEERRRSVPTPILAMDVVARPRHSRGTRFFSKIFFFFF
jgi:hypothetical protein